MNRLTEKQREALEIMERGENLFVTGLSGSGKSTVIRRFVEENRHKKNIYITSTTGVSALLVKGSTIHSFAGIGLGVGDAVRLVGKVASNRKALNRWKRAQVLIIDEISMMSPVLFEKLEFIARQVRMNPNPFGGIQLILSGDFCQLPCVDSEKFCFESEVWEKCIPNTVYLNEIVRQSDAEFQTILNEVRVGILSKKTKDALLSRVGVVLTNDLGIKPTKVYPTNSQVSFTNEVELKKLKPREMNSYEMTITCSNSDIKEKFLKNAVVEENITLCDGAQVMLLYNLDTEAGLVNGSRGVVTGFTVEDSFPIVKFLNGLELPIPYVCWEVEEDNIVVLKAIQIPLKIAYAVTVHKIQGCTLDYAEMDLSNIFEYGQAYVALSRVQSFENLSLIDISLEKIRCNPNARDYYGALLRASPLPIVALRPSASPANPRPPGDTVLHPL